MRDQKDQNGSYRIRRIREESMGKRGGVKRGENKEENQKGKRKRIRKRGWWKGNAQLEKW